MLGHYNKCHRLCGLSKRLFILFSQFWGSESKVRHHWFGSWWRIYPFPYSFSSRFQGCPDYSLYTSNGICPRTFALVAPPPPPPRPGLGAGLHSLCTCSSPCLGALYLSTAWSFTFSKLINTGFELTFISRNQNYHCKLSGAHNGHMINRILHKLWITEGPGRIWTYLAVIPQFPFKWHLLGLPDHSVSLSSQDSLVPFPD